MNHSEASQTNSTPVPFRVLCLDGGGMRGLYTASVLAALAKQFADCRNVTTLDIGKGFDLICGTSTGGILACALAFGKSAQEIVDLYRNFGPKVFTNPIPEGFHKFRLARWCWENRNKAANSNVHLRQALLDLFSSATMETIYRSRGIALCIASVNVATGGPRVFKTPHDPNRQMDRRYPLVDICLATSAAPIFLPLVTLHDPLDATNFQAFADGGLWANNPTLIGLIEALSLCDRRPIEIISVGTLPAPEGTVLGVTDLNRGVLGWRAGTKVLTMSMNAQSAAAGNMVRLLATHINSLGQRVEVHRLPERPPSLDQIKHLNLDSADDTALHVLRTLGTNDGITAYSLTHDSTNRLGIILTNIFDSIPEISR